MPAAELRLYVVRVLVLEKVPVPASSFVRVVSLHIRRLELMVMRGLLDRLLERGRQRPVADFRLRRGRGLALGRTERLTAGGWPGPGRRHRGSHGGRGRAGAAAPPRRVGRLIGEHQQGLDEHLTRWFGEPAG
jgi:hypothetical protein